MEEKYYNEMKKIIKNYSYDTESLHCYQDDLLCELLEKLGYHNLIELYKSTHKWYA